MNQLMEWPVRSSSSAVSVLTMIAANQEKTVTVAAFSTIPTEGLSEKEEKINQ